MIDGHPGLLAKLLAKRPLAAALLLAETLQNKGAAKAGRQRGQQFVQQRFALRRRGIIRRVAMALQRQRQLGKKQFGHRISLRVAPGALMLKLANHLARLRHTCAAHAPVGLPRRAEEARDRPGPVKIELQPLRAIDDVLQNQIVNGSIGVFIFGANVEQIAAGNAPGAIVKDVQPVASPHQHQLAELMGMFGKDILRVAVCHRHCLCGGREKLLFT